MSRHSLRRSLVILTAVASLFAGAAAIRAAAGWTADAAPLGDQPPNPATLVQQLQDEQARAGSLSDQLNQVTAHAAELESALQAAKDKATSDASTADDLTSQLAAARKRLAQLEEQMAAANGATQTTVVTTIPASAPATPASTPYEHEDDGSGGGDD